MNRVRRVCRTCGREFVACNAKPDTGVFRWQDFTCSPECGAQYLEKISREQSPDSNN